MCVCICISNKAHRAQIKLRSSLESHADKKHLVHAIKSNESQRRYAATSFFSLSWSLFFVKHPATNLQRHPSLLNKKNWKNLVEIVFFLAIETCIQVFRAVEITFYCFYIVLLHAFDATFIFSQKQKLKRSTWIKQSESFVLLFGNSVRECVYLYLVVNCMRFLLLTWFTVQARPTFRTC